MGFVLKGGEFGQRLSVVCIEGRRVWSETQCGLY